jgi:hypothetical protein
MAVLIFRMTPAPHALGVMQTTSRHF